MMKKLRGAKSPIALRRLCTVAAVLLLLFSVMVIAPTAAEDATKTYTLEGEGTEASPFLIKSVENLTTMRDAINDLDLDTEVTASITPQNGGDPVVASKAYYRLENDINLNNEEWVPIAFFEGTLDGNNKKIQNIVIKESHTLSFGANLAPGFIATTTMFYGDGLTTVIKDLTIENAEIVANGLSAGVFIAESSSERPASLINCNLIGTIKITGSSVSVGSLIGSADCGTTISGCDVTGTLMIESSGVGSVGGLVGAIASEATISDCTIDVESDSYVKGTGVYEQAVGGLVGSHSIEAGSITGCTVNTPVSGKVTVGGLIGSLGSTQSDAVIENCDATGSVTLEAGGKADYAAVGGLVGEVSKSSTGDYVEIKECTSTTTISVAEGVTVPVYAGFVGSAITSGYPATSNTEDDINGLKEKVSDCTFTLATDNTNALVANENINRGTWAVIAPQYTIAFDSNGGDAIPAITAGYGASLTEPKPTYTGYEFVGWEKDGVAYTFPSAMPVGDMTLTATWKKIEYIITWKLADGTTENTKVAHGEIPAYKGTAAPTQANSADGKYSYVFNGWSPALYPADKAQIYTAQFTEIEILPPSSSGSTGEAAPEPTPIQPVIPVEVVETKNNEGKTETTIVTSAGDDSIKVSEEDKSVVEITAANNDAAVIKVKFENDLSQSGNTNAVTGVVEGVTISYKPSVAEAAPSEMATETISYQMDLNLKTVVKDLPKIDSTINDTAVKAIDISSSNLKPIAMVTATNTGAINAALKTDGGKVTLVFTVPGEWYNSMKAIYSFHVKEGQMVGTPTPVPASDITPLANGDYQITIYGTSFSTHGIAGEEKTEEQTQTPTSSGSSTTQGSSVWLTEPQTSTPTETAQPTPSDTIPTDIPTDIPTTQPTEQPKSPGFGILGVLAGLGAVAVLRRK